MLTAWHAFVRGRVLWVSWEVKAADCWIGLYWRYDAPFLTGGRWKYRQHAWICLVPCLPLHLSWLREIGEEAGDGR